MSATVIKLVPDDEIMILTSYLNEDSSTNLESIYDKLGVTEGCEEAPRQAIAVAQILLHDIQNELPSWGFTKDDGTVVLGRLPHQRHPDARLNFSPKHLLTINWADSGPGFSWPESYYITYLPAFEKYIVTASRDGEDAYGCTDHAIGFANGNLSELEAAKHAITQNWREQSSDWDQARWAYLFAEGLVDRAMATQWADEVWPDNIEDEDEEDCDE